MEYMGNTYFGLKNQVIKAERRILKELGFCVHVKHPHKIIIMYLQILDCETNTLLAQKAWNFMNDSFRTNVFVRYPPETIACACIFLSSRQLGISLPTRPPWWELFSAKLEDLEEISVTLLSLYTRAKANLDTLQKAVGEIRKDLAQKKSEGKADGAAAANNSTPNLSPTGGTTAARDDSRTGSRPSSPSKVSPTSAASLPDGKKKKSSSKDEEKRTSYKERPISRGSRRSRSPVNRRSRSRSRSRSQSRSRSYSLSISPDNVSRSESESSDESPDKHKAKSKRRRSPTRGRDEDKRTRPRKYDGEYVRRKARTDGVISYKGENTRERSRSPLSRSRSRSRSHSPGKRPRGKYEHGRDKKKREDRHRDRNGVDYRTARDKGRDHGRHRR